VINNYRINKFRATVLTALLVSSTLIFQAEAATVYGVAGNLPGTANLIAIDSTTHLVTDSVALPDVTSYLGSILVAGSKIYVSKRCSVFELSASPLQLLRTLEVLQPNCIAGNNHQLDRMVLDSTTNRLIVASGGVGVFSIDLITGIASDLLGLYTDVKSIAIRPETRQLFVGTWAAGIYVIDIDNITAAPLLFANVRANSGFLNGGTDLQFIDKNTLFAGFYGVATYDVSPLDTGGTPTVLNYSFDGDAGWGYDFMLTSDLKTIYQPGWMQSRVRNVADFSTVAHPAAEEVNYYYGSAAPVGDGSFVVSSGDLANEGRYYGSIGRGVIQFISESDFSLTATLDLSASYNYISFRGIPGSPAPRVTYAWSADVFGACSKSCGGGVQFRSVSCIGSDGSIDSTGLGCLGQAEPSSIQGCSEQACPVIGCVKPAKNPLPANTCGGSKEERGKNSQLKVCLANLEKARDQVRMENKKNHKAYHKCLKAERKTKKHHRTCELRNEDHNDNDDERS